ncbi:MAG: hypothetical protein IPP83_13990 [Flavobacteriales bacterium]|nr:hypothetical protein [Flavobacteriales bacterium]
MTVTMSNGWPDFSGFEKYQFNDLRTWVPNEEQVAFDGTLDEKGEASFDLELNMGRSAPAVVNTNIVTRVFEVSGDASMDQVSVPYYPYSSYVGMKLPELRNSWGTFQTDTTYKFAVVSVDAHGKPIASHALKAQVYKLNYNWWWDGSITGSSSYISSPSVELQQEQQLTTDAKGKAVMKFRIDASTVGPLRGADHRPGERSRQRGADLHGLAGLGRTQSPTGPGPSGGVELQRRQGEVQRRR